MKMEYKNNKKYPGSTYPKKADNKAAQEVKGKSGMQTDGGSKYQQIKCSKC